MTKSASAKSSNFRSSVHCGDSTMQGLTPTRVDNETFIADIQFGFQITDAQLTAIRSVCAPIDGVHHRRGKEVVRVRPSRLRIHIHVGSACNDRNAGINATAIASEARDEIQRWFDMNRENTRRPQPDDEQETVSAGSTRHSQVSTPDATPGYLNNPFGHNR